MKSSMVQFQCPVSSPSGLFTNIDQKITSFAVASCKKRPINRKIRSKWTTRWVPAPVSRSWSPGFRVPWLRYPWTESRWFLARNVTSGDHFLSSLSRLFDSHRWPGSKFEEKMSWKCSLESRDSRKDPANANKVNILLSFGSISWRIAEEIIGNLCRCRCSDKLEILLLDGFACCCSMLQLVLGQWLVVISSLLLLYLM